VKPYLIVASDVVKTGGMDRANYAVSEYLARREIEVHIVAHRVSNDLVRYPNVFFHQMPKIAGSYFLSSPLLDYAGRYWARKLLKRGGRVVVNGGNCAVGDVNWVHYVHAAGGFYASNSLIHSLKDRLERKWALMQERRIVRRARVVVATCEKMKREVIEYLAVPENRVHLVYLGIDTDLFRPISSETRRRVRQKFGLPPDRPIVIFIGALGNRRKGFDVLLNSWKMLCRESGWDAHLVVVGAGAEISFWQRQATISGVADRVRFFGFLSNVPELLAACDLLVLPSRYEPYSLVVQEALCCGLPAFVSASAGIAERYPKELAGLLLPNPEDPIDLAQRLKRWRSDQEGYQKAVSEFSKLLRSWTWEDMAREMVGVIESS